MPILRLSRPIGANTDALSELVLANLADDPYMRGLGALPHAELTELVRVIVISSAQYADGEELAAGHCSARLSVACRDAAIRVSETAYSIYSIRDILLRFLKQQNNLGGAPVDELVHRVSGFFDLLVLGALRNAKRARGA